MIFARPDDRSRKACWDIWWQQLIRTWTERGCTRFATRAAPAAVSVATLTIVVRNVFTLAAAAYVLFVQDWLAMIKLCNPSLLLSMTQEQSEWVPLQCKARS